MKTPRITDFDPDAKIPSLKSSLDNMPSIKNRKVVQQSSSIAQNTSQLGTMDKKYDNKNTAEPPPTILQPSKRPYIRRTFDFYEDQIAYLTEQSLKEKLAGKEGSMNSMVREAIDEWIKKRTAKS